MPWLLFNTIDKRTNKPTNVWTFIFCVRFFIYSLQFNDEVNNKADKNNLCL